MKKLLLLQILLIMAGALANAQNKPVHITQTTQLMLKVNSKDTTLIMVELTIDTTAEVCIKKFGNFQGPASITIVTGDSVLEVCPASQTQFIAIAVPPGGILLGADEASLPEQSFPGASREYTISHPNKFSIQLLAAMNKETPLGYTNSIKGSIVQFSTAYTRFYHNETLHLNGEIAFFISFEQETNKNPSNFKVAFKARENKDQDSAYREAGKEVMEQCTKKVDEFVNILNK